MVRLSRTHSPCSERQLSQRCLIWALQKILKRELKSESGQAMVESAIVIPLMTFFILGIVQLVMIQHAKIMTEYAAFNAARAGIVWNADRIIMENAALISLLPTFDGVLSQGNLGDPSLMLKRVLQRAALYQMNRRLPQAIDIMHYGADRIINQIPIDQVQDRLGSEVDDLALKAEQAADQALTEAITNALGPGGDDLRLVDINVISPSLDSFPLGGNVDANADFDINNMGRRTREHNFDDFEQRDNTRLTIEVRYLYMMRIPFANWVIHQAWFATMWAERLYGAVWNPQASVPGETGFREIQEFEYPTEGPPLYVRIANLARTGIYLIPLTASYTMRMQSNPYRQSLQVQ